MYCSTCGERLAGNWRFCPMCGMGTQPTAAVQRDEGPAQILQIRNLRELSRDFAAFDSSAHGSSRHFQQQFLFAITG